MRYRIYVIKVFIEVYFYRLLSLCGYKLSFKEIPEGCYCYLPDLDKNSNKDNNDHSYYIKTCKYYRGLKGYNAGCIYTGVCGGDILLGDQCKICGENDNYTEE